METRHFIKTLCKQKVKRDTHLRFNAIKMLKKISLGLLTQVEIRHFIKTLRKQKVKTFFLSTLIALKIK